jgi:hypothetical protein
MDKKEHRLKKQKRGKKRLDRNLSKLNRDQRILRVIEREASKRNYRDQDDDKPFQEEEEFEDLEN